MSGSPGLNPNTHEGVLGHYRPAGPTEQVPEQPELYRDFVSINQTRKPSNLRGLATNSYFAECKL